MDNSAFLKIPKSLFSDERFRILSPFAKLLYGLLLDRLSLSKKNGWLDDNGRTYIFFTQKEAAECLGTGKAKTIKIFVELERAKLIFRKRIGLGKPNMIYVHDASVGFGEQTSRGNDSDTSRGSQNRLQEVSQTDSNKTDINKTDNNKTDYREIDREKRRAELYKKIDYPVLTANYDKREIDTIVKVIIDVICSGKNSITIGNKRLTNIKERYSQLNYSHIEYVLECLKNSNASVKNIRNYLLTALYNAPDTMDLYYSMQVRHDMRQYRNIA